MITSSPPSDSRLFAHAKSWRWVVVAALLLFGVVVLGAVRWADNHARTATDLTAGQYARSSARELAGELQKFRLLPLVLTEYPDARMVLNGGNPDAVQRMNRKLELLAERTNAAAIYLIAPDGKTIAASNWREPQSFVGQDYGFRPYFRDAMANGEAELFALGTVSGRPGLFLARRIEEAGRSLGVIVVKVEFDGLEKEWAQLPLILFVTDDHGVVIITNRPDWRFRTLTTIDEKTRASIRSALQFGNLPLSALPLKQQGTSWAIGPVRYRQAVLPVPMDNARIHALMPLAPADASANATARSAVLVLFMALAALLIWAYRVREKRRLREEALAMLEFEVAARTADLVEANQRYRAGREELAQANRLGTIGQITAGVAHEINQPVAAIRSFAENSVIFLERGNAGQARENLGTIVSLTERIGAIVSQLRSFARRGTPAMERVEIGKVIDGALLLVGDRVREGGVAIERREPDGDLYCMADRVRLEQILVNLFQNALDALAGILAPRIRIEVTGQGPIIIQISDNGSGIDPALADTLFTPFATGKANGLGLGLGIARDIAREFGGTLEVVPSPLGGAAFALTIPSYD